MEKMRYQENDNLDIKCLQALGAMPGEKCDLVRSIIESGETPPKELGFFSEMGHSDNCGSIRDYLCDEVDYDKEDVIRYLDHGYHMASCPRRPIDCITGEYQEQPSFLVVTDGEYMWCDYLQHHIQNYNVRLPEEFLVKVNVWSEERQRWRDGVLGFIVGDALGVPVEFTHRNERAEDPVTGMRSYGTHNQPAGTWSDDSSMVLATLASIQECHGLDFDDMMRRFSDWCLFGDYTPFQDVFDIGVATSRAIMNYARGTKATQCGGQTVWDNGNGSLMRVLPICLYLHEQKKTGAVLEKDMMVIVHETSCLTHGHLRSQIACGMYYQLVYALFESECVSLQEKLQDGMDKAFAYYDGDALYQDEFKHFDRLKNLEEFKMIPEEEILSSGYVIHTLEAAVWCILNTETYAEAVLKAVNLGDDTDTVAAVTGGLAGLYYGENGIPSEWIQALQKLEWIESLL